jgi:hypothetical protein
MFVLSSFKGEIMFRYKISEPLALHWDLKYDSKRRFVESTKIAHRQIVSLG